MSNKFPILPKDYKIYNTQADRAVRFINGLTHTKGDHARHAFSLRPWQEFKIIRPLFGKLNADKKRVIRTVFVGLPRKNGKSEIAAAIALKCLISDGEIGGEIYSAASDRGQASLVFNVAKGMVMNDPVLRKKCKIVDSQKRIIYEPTGSFYQAISADADTKHGFNASVIIYDEVHTAKNRDLWDVLITSMGARSQPLVIAITTAGYDKASLCWELWDYALKVRDGIIKDESFLPVIYAAPEESDWLNEAIWHAVNPALGDFRQIQEMREAAERAKHIPAMQNTFRRLYLNQWTNSETCWIPPEEWTECGCDMTPEEWETELLGRPCWVGVDLSATRDITAVVLLFPYDDGSYRVLPYFYVPKENARDNQRTDRVGYVQWIEDGHLFATEGNVVDQDAIENFIKNEFGTKFNIKEIAIDRWNSSQMQTHLIADGFLIVPYGQGFKDMNSPSKELETLVITRKILHNNNAVMNWMISNVQTETDAAGNIKPSKKKSSKKIDGVVALIMALGRAMVHVADGESVYEERGLLIL